MRHIFLADDDEDDVMFFKIALEHIGNKDQLTVFNNGEELMQHLKSTSVLPNVLFLDLNMPLKSGIECITEIRKNVKFENLPIVVYTTAQQEFIINEMYYKGANYYFSKTPNPELMKTYLQMILSKKPDDVNTSREEFLVE